MNDYIWGDDIKLNKPDDHHWQGWEIWMIRQIISLQNQKNTGGTMTLDQEYKFALLNYMVILGVDAPTFKEWLLVKQSLLERQIAEVDYAIEDIKEEPEKEKPHGISDTIDGGE